jgi:hypothetical protein
MARHCLTFEAAMLAGGSAREDDIRTGEIRGLISGRCDATSYGVALGVGTGRTWNGVTGSQLVFAQGSVWGQLGPVTIHGSVMPNAMRDGTRYTDTELGAGVSGSRADVEASVGTRGGHAFRLNGQTFWGGAAATFWMTPIIGVVVTAGTYPPSLTQALPGGRYASAALRIALRPTRNVPIASRETQRDVLHSRPSFILTQSTRGRYVIRIYEPTARSVELMSDITQWTPVSLTRSRKAGWWEVPLLMSPGTHQLNVRINGGDWEVPEGVMSITDEFGGTTGLFEVP